MRIFWLCTAIFDTLFDDLRDDAGADGLAALADGKPQALLHRNGRNQRHHHLHVVPRHHHIGPFGQLAAARHVGGPEVKLRPVPREERRMPPACPSSRSFLNISTPVHTVFKVGFKPTISSSSPTFTIPRSTRPVTTVPRPEIENTSSTGIRNGPSTARLGIGM